MNARRASSLAFVAGLLALYATGVSVRAWVFRAQHVVVGPRIPFTLESALEFRRVQQVYESGGLPAVDPAVGYPAGVDVRRTYTIGSEYVYAALARLLPASWDLEERVRWVSVCWFCLGIPLLALWVAWASGSRWAGWAAAAFYAVAASSVRRSTGQELSRENLALPLLVAHLAFDALARRMPKEAAWGRRLAALASAAALGVAVAGWDMLQLYVVLWAAQPLARLARGRHDGDASGGMPWVLQGCALLLVCVANPYARAHAWILSPGMLLGYGVVLLRILEGYGRLDRRPAMRIAIGLIPLAAGLLLARIYADSYGHFAELLWAKIRFLNRKPQDPGLLTFCQRIMWVPGLQAPAWRFHPVTAGSAWAIFPAMLVLTLAGAVVVSTKQIARPNPFLTQQLIFCGTSLLAFVLFLRFHVFLALFASSLIGCWLAEALRSSWWKRWLVVAALAIGWTVEARNVLGDPLRWGRPGVYYEELGGLCEWLAEHAAPAPVLANFGTGASILTYGGCPILLHPKFESEDVRRKVEEYGRALFKGTEKEFRDWADDNGARYYVHGVGEFSGYAPDRQMRYMVDAMNPPEQAPARIFEDRPEEARYFSFLWGNAKYRVFRIIRWVDEAEAERLGVHAEKALEGGDIEQTERLAADALALDPHNERALKMMRHGMSLHDQEFTYDPEDKAVRE